MSDKTKKWEDNIPGKFYVDKECIFCSLCHELAPSNFKESSAGDHDIVFKQPTSDEELSQCQEAIENCPVEAIGKDGEDV
jgi:ferredoxin